MSKERVEAFSDGVFAIILTLLVFGLHVPTVAAHSSLRAYAVTMAPLIPQVVSFALTFVMICVYWVGHHQFFRHVGHVTIALVWLNNLFLLWVCLLPFPTALLGTHPTDQFPLLLYGVDALLGALAFAGLRHYARHAKLFPEERASTLGPRRSVPSIVLYAASIAFAFVSVYASLACFFAVPVLYSWKSMRQA